MGLFADIARFRKPEADEVTVESSGKANSTGAVNGSEESVSGEKENSSALDNVGKFCVCVLCSVLFRSFRSYHHVKMIA